VTALKQQHIQAHNLHSFQLACSASSSAYFPFCPWSLLEEEGGNEGLGKGGGGQRNILKCFPSAPVHCLPVPSLEGFKQGCLPTQSTPLSGKVKLPTGYSLFVSHSPLSPSTWHRGAHRLVGQLVTNLLPPCYPSSSSLPPGRPRTAIRKLIVSDTRLSLSRPYLDHWSQTIAGLRRSTDLQERNGDGHMLLFGSLLKANSNGEIYKGKTPR
jgi:hypothetical protein